MVSSPQIQHLFIKSIFIIDHGSGAVQQGSAANPAASPDPVTRPNNDGLHSFLDVVKCPITQLVKTAAAALLTGSGRSHFFHVALSPPAAINSGITSD